MKKFLRWSIITSTMILILFVFLFGNVSYAQETTKEKQKNEIRDKLISDLKQDDQMKLAGRMIWITTATDLVSTEIFLARGRTEFNPLVQKRAIRIPTKIGAAWAANRLTKFSADKGHKKTALVIRWSVVIALAVASGNNVVISF